ncbi:hypothetical protein Ancab_000753 [Ancistrocladus abbreviatus]
MASKPSTNKGQKVLCLVMVICLSLSLLFISFNIHFGASGLINLRHLEIQPTATTITTYHHPIPNRKPPKWFDNIVKHSSKPRTNIKVGLVNLEEDEDDYYLSGLTRDMTIKAEFDRVSSSLEWEKLFPEWISEDHVKYGKPKCPEIPMPEVGKYRGLDVVVARVPCGNGSRWRRDGIRDVFRLQVNLAVANLVVENSGGTGGVEREVYVVFVGRCEPMWEIFRCDDMLWHKEGEYRVYKPNVRKLKEKVLMPVGTCEIAHPWNNSESGSNGKLSIASDNGNDNHPREAYVTVLHSSEQYVCGAIALAQSLIQSNTTKDLILLADRTISRRSIQGLRAAGWKIKRIKRISSPNAKKDAYNKWNYSKLNVWQLTEYDKLMFIDSDFIILKNIDHFFAYPQLSAVGNDRWIFNSGIMIIEPSQCLFNHMMNKRYTLDSYNGGDQGFLNEIFTWWHRLTIKLNYLKIYGNEDAKKNLREVPNDLYTIHFLGLKPWTCYRDYDCNWDKEVSQIFASDDAHKRWWQVYDRMPKRLQGYCGLTKEMDGTIRKWRGIARKANLSNGHWKIQVKDPRQHVSSYL